MSTAMIDLAEKPRVALLLGVQLPDVSDEEFADSLGELGRLARTLGIEVAGQLTQKRSAFDPGAYLGPGKRAELSPRVEAGEFDTLLVDHEISPSQARYEPREGWRERRAARQGTQQLGYAAGSAAVPSTGAPLQPDSLHQPHQC